MCDKCVTCYKTNSTPKLLIYMGFQLCFFYRHFSKTVDLQGLSMTRDNISTKLSTESLDAR